MTIRFCLACSLRVVIRISSGIGRIVQNFGWKTNEQGKYFALHASVFLSGIHVCMCLCFTVIQRRMFMLRDLNMVVIHLIMRVVHLMDIRILEGFSATHSNLPKRNWNSSIELHKLLRSENKTMFGAGKQKILLNHLHLQILLVLTQIPIDLWV